MTRPQFHPAFYAAIVAIGILGAGCDISVGDGGFSLDVASGKATDEWTRAYTVSSGGELVIININGTVNASASDGKVVEVRAERIAKASTDEAAQELLKRIELHEEVSPSRVRVETRVPRQRFGRQSHEVRYHVRVPAGLKVTFETTNGGVRMENLDGQITASTTNGGVTGRGISGSVNASTTNGGVQIEMAEVTGDVELETTNGGIRLELPSDARATVEARCTNGGISVDGLNLDAVQKSRRRFSGTLNGGGHKISAETTNGGIRIRGRGARTTN
jgi:hypothetical protein